MYTTQNNKSITIKLYEYGDEVMVEFERPKKRLQHMSTIQNIVLSMHHFISTCETDKFLRETAYVRYHFINTYVNKFASYVSYQVVDYPKH